MLTSDYGEGKCSKSLQHTKPLVIPCIHSVQAQNRQHLQTHVDRSFTEKGYFTPKRQRIVFRKSIMTAHIPSRSAYSQHISLPMRTHENGRHLLLRLAHR